mgnify:CR=1 FL=1
MNSQLHELLLTKKNTVELQTRNIEAPAAHDVGVRNSVSLISPGTELALYTGTHIGFKDPDITWAEYPIRPGYASIGKIEAIGEAVMNFRVGDMVLHYQPHADYSLVDTRKAQLFKLPPDIEPQQALFARFGQIAYTAVAASQKTDGYVLVYGGGIVGNLCAQIFLHRKNRPVILADISTARLALAHKCGIHTCINPAVEDIGTALSKKSHEAGVNTVVEATGVPALVESALENVNLQGEVVLLGSTRGRVELDVYKMIHRKATMVIGAHESRFPLFGNSTEQKSQHFFSTDVLSMIASQIIKVTPFITDSVTPDRVSHAYQMLIDDPDTHIGVLINWN